MTTKNSKHDIKQWLNEIYYYLKGVGKTEYIHAELPEHLQNRSFHLSAARMEMIQDTGRVVINKTVYQKVWKLKLRHTRAWQVDRAKELYAMGKSIRHIAHSTSMSVPCVKREVNQA